MSRSHGSHGGYLERPRSSSLADVVEMILDKGLVIDAFVRVSLVGIEVITIDARIVIASVDTYLKFAEATNRLDLMKTGPRDLPGLVSDMTEGAASSKTKGVLGGIKDALTGSEEEEKPPQASAQSQQSQSSRPRQRSDDAEGQPARRRKDEG
ncbi:gas vesicle protein GvpJ [Xylanimonas sp. McL0601]